MPNYLVTLNDGRKLKIGAESEAQARTAGETWQRDNPPGAVAGVASREYGPFESAGEGYLKGFSANWRDEIYGASKASGLPEWMGGFRAPVGAIEMALDRPGAREEYQRARDEMRQREREMQAQHPLAFGAGEVGGGATGMLTTGAAGRAAGVLRPAAATFPGRVAQAGIGGAGWGATAGAGEAETLKDVPKEAAAGTGTGGLLGLAGGVAGEVASRIGSGVANVIRGARDPEAEASRRIAQAVGSDMRPPFTPEEQAEMAAAGTTRALIDENEYTRALARSSANVSPGARQDLEEFTRERFRGQPVRLTQYIRDLVGGPRAADVLERLQAQARAANAPAYRAAYAAGEQGIWSPTLERLTSAPAVRQAMRDAVARGGNRAVAEGYGGFNPGVTFEGDIMRFGQGRGAPPYPNAQFWDYVARELSDAIGAATRAGRKEEAGALTGLRRSLLAELDAVNPAFAQARRGASQFFGAENALEAGQNFTKSSASIDDARRAWQRYSPAERELFSRGYASQLADEIEKTGYNRDVLNSTFINNQAARQRMELALGPQRTRRLEALLRAEAIVDRARKALGNSTTARQLLEMGMAGGADWWAEGEFNPKHVLSATIGPLAIRHGLSAIDAKTAQRVGELLLSNDPTIVTRGIQMLASNDRLMNGLRRASNAILGGGVTPPATGAVTDALGLNRNDALAVP